MSKITLPSLPYDESSWLTAAYKYEIVNPKEASLHEYDFDKSSGSKVGNKQVLLLHQHWMRTIPAFNQKKPVSDQIVLVRYLEEARSLLGKQKPWNAYLKWIKETPNKVPAGPEAEAMGQYGLVLQSQQYTKGIADDGSDDNKVVFSPKLTRSRARALQSGPSFRPQTPATPTPVHSSQAALDRSPGDMDIDASDDEFSPYTSSVDQPSPKTGEVARQESKIKSEQEVIVSIVLFARSVCNPCQQVAGITWHPHQEVFAANNKNGEKTFVARVDAVMRHEGITRNPSFVETKRVLRYATPHGASIKAQEACQIAAKIAQHPPENLQEMRAKNLTTRYDNPRV